MTFKKIAKPLPKIPEIKLEESGKKSLPPVGDLSKKPSYPGAPITSTNVPAVGQMQLAIKDLSDRMGKFFHNVGKLDQPSMQKAKGEPQANTLSFGNFLVQNYGDVLEKTPDNDIQEKDRVKKSAYNISNILEQLQKLGGPKSEYKVDNNWGPRTNDALLNIKNIAKILNTLKKDLAVAIDDVDLNDLYAPESKEKLDELKKSGAENIAKIASKNTEVINKISSFFEALKKDGFSQIAPYLQGTKAIATIGDKLEHKEKPITEEEHNAMEILKKFSKGEASKYELDYISKYYGINLSKLNQLKDGIALSVKYNDNNIIKDWQLKIPLITLLDKELQNNTYFNNWLAELMGSEIVDSNPSIINQISEQLNKLDMSSLLE